MVRPSLVVADPLLMASQPATELAASAMNALAHGMEALYTPLANPVAECTALRGAELIASDDVALGALLCGWASGMTGFAVHHATCQILVRTAGSPHAQTNAVMLPHFAGMMAGRVPGVIGEFGRALGDPDGDPEAAAGRVAKLSARSGHTRLATLGVEERHLPPVAAAVMGAPGAEANSRPARGGRAPCPPAGGPVGRGDGAGGCGQAPARRAAAGCQPVHAGVPRLLARAVGPAERLAALRGSQERPGLQDRRRPI